MMRDRSCFGERIRRVTQRQKARFSLKKTVAILAVLTVWIGGGLSLFASANPDGLGMVYGESCRNHRTRCQRGGIWEGRTRYAGVGSCRRFRIMHLETGESMAGTSFSGVAGAAVVVAVCVGGCYLFKFFGKNQKHE